MEGKVQLILTSPPFPLNHKKSYGNLTGEEYLKWFQSLAPALAKLLTPDGSIVIEIGNGWEPGRPVQSLLPLKHYWDSCSIQKLGFDYARNLCATIRPAFLRPPHGSQQIASVRSTVTRTFGGWRRQISLKLTTVECCVPIANQ